MIRELISKLNRSLSDRLVSARRRHKAPMKVWFDPEVRTERGIELARAACILGETVDMSRTGLAFLVPSIRVKEKYLVGHERPLNIEIDLPNGKVYLRAMGRRYEKVGLHVSTERFLVGVHISNLEGHDKDLYEAFLTGGDRRPRAAAAQSIGVTIE
ncbi:MAG: PilZ domain-containing protein [Acidobacteria bacterium]|nr:PilZ domain-containing protein [Acidobacteriota bacterium]